MTDRRRQIDATIGRLERLGAGKLDDAINALLDRRNKIDGWGNGGSFDGVAGGERSVTIDEPCTGERLCIKHGCPDAGTRHTHPCPIRQPHDHPASVPVTAIEAAIVQREHVDELIRNLDDELNAIRLCAGNLENDCDRYLRQDLPEQPKPRCDGGVGRTGYLEWGDPTCTNIPDRYRKQCSRCRKAEDRWLKAHGERRHIGEDV